MVVKRSMALLLSGMALGALAFAAPAFAQSAQSQEQMQQEINSLQQQLNQLQAQQSTVSGLYNQAPPPMATKGPAWLGGVNVSFAGSWIEAATVWRQRNELADGASDLAFSSVGSFPNSPLYHENEWRASARQSRIAITIGGDIDPSQHLKAYYESDFLGAGVTPNSRESNSYNLRIRQAFLEYDNDNSHFHMSAGQQWSLVTQNRVGMLPKTENSPLTIDAQYVSGFTWARQESARFVEDWNKVVWFGFAVESPQASFGGTTIPGPNAAYPFDVNANNACAAGGLFNSTTYCSNDIAPDLVEKVALDPGWGHYEAFGIQRWFADEVSPFLGAGVPAQWSTKTTFGWGVGGSVLLPALPKVLDLQGNVMYGDGIGRYGSAQLPDTTIGPNGQLVALPELRAMVGAVAHPFDGLEVYAYAGEEAVQAKFFGPGTTALGGGGYGNPLFPNDGCFLSANAAGGGPFAGACTANAKSASEFTIGFWQNIYKGPVGRFVFGAEYEYVKVTSFATDCALAGAQGCVAGGGHTPNAGINPDNNIFFTSIRYYPF